jgi:hypothetical protein
MNQESKIYTAVGTFHHLSREKKGKKNMCGSLDQRKHTHTEMLRRKQQTSSNTYKTPQVEHHPGRGMRTQIIKREEMGSRRRIPHHPCTEKGAAASPSCLLHR